ncbi:hypothetical protein HHL17_06420 [Chitinophaga sp. G-6-1-13]|uniref:Uncharacterized protein n=1 Tax=Chitinophaga fulva TaxID=2728842 RepID=A0A848GFF6_9BACT|nr:hypothetical protein [Chitinophaga fulva]NML36826.1 hypothetical protein [Chitinophaga fulva]
MDSSCLGILVAEGAKKLTARLENFQILVFNYSGAVFTKTTRSITQHQNIKMM